ncbi:hypothetical protein OIDMADRAFT_27536 [Oidiodendron maius Zn]|uniref:Wax synthase domain-containing protein n=1 Tax=Oidiodendron maius (strain Zn) TaxID=913774 RepID=A0A0C3HJ35_OIDMZ|nr:hypothetical protein OIDMADRAFT_27536 [Oidiodendron maius Zn]
MSLRDITLLTAFLFLPLGLDANPIKQMTKATPTCLPLLADVVFLQHYLWLQVRPRAFTSRGKKTIPTNPLQSQLRRRTVRDMRLGMRWVCRIVLGIISMARFWGLWVPPTLMGTPSLKSFWDSWISWARILLFLNLLVRIWDWRRAHMPLTGSICSRNLQRTRSVGGLLLRTGKGPSRAAHVWRPGCATVNSPHLVLGVD